jgi:hypothetical protein
MPLGVAVSFLTQAVRPMLRVQPEKPIGVPPYPTDTFNFIADSPTLMALWVHRWTICAICPIWPSIYRIYPSTRLQRKIAGCMKASVILPYLGGMMTRGDKNTVFEMLLYACRKANGKSYGELFGGHTPQGASGADLVIDYERRVRL